MSALGARFDLVGKYSIVKGLPWSFTLTRRAGANRDPVDLTGCHARMVIYDTLAVPEDPPVVPFEVSDITGEIALGGILGTIAIDLDDEQTAMTLQRGAYRLYFTDSGGAESLLLRGRIGLIEEGEP
jgi:hypothetical protein